VAKAGQTGSLAAWAWALIAGVAIFELLAHTWIQARIPSDGSWEAASAFVRERYRSGDRIVGAPSWVGPIVRNHLGDLLPLRTAALSDLGGIDREWEISIRGARSRKEPPDLEEQFDEVRVRMWFLNGDRVRYDFVEQIEHAEVELVTPDGPHPCPWIRERPAGGGLGYGPMPPAVRFVCDSQRPWLWVGATVLTDLDLQPRRCVWQHPAGADPVRVTFSEVPIGDRLMIHGGIDYNSERQRVHGPVVLRVWIEDRLVGELIHRDGDGWSGIEIDTSDFALDRATVRFETTADDPNARLFCWSASTRRDR